MGAPKAKALHNQMTDGTNDEHIRHDEMPAPSLMDQHPSDPSSLTYSLVWREVQNLKEMLQMQSRKIREILETRILAVEHGIEVAHDDVVRFPTEVDKRVFQLQSMHDERMKGMEQRVMEKFVANDQRWNDNTILRTNQFTAIEKLFEERLQLINQRWNDTDKLRMEQFGSIKQQFVERDTRFDQTNKDSKVAIDAALQAAEKAVAKQNESFQASITKSEAATQKQIDAQASSIHGSTEGLEGKIADLKERVLIIEGKNTGAGLPDKILERISLLEASKNQGFGRELGPNPIDAQTALRLNTIEAMFNKMAGQAAGPNPADAETAAKLRAIETTLTAIAGRSGGMKELWGFITAGIVFLIAVVGFFLQNR